jgi:murein DD-endopeptidase MepM/ murein hydrolase activator NlpD
MATLGNYAAALGGMAKEAITGTAKGLVGGLKGAMIREAPGIAGAYAFGKDLNKRANSQSSSPRMSGVNSPSPSPSQTSPGILSPLGGLSQAVSLVAEQHKSNVINLEEVRQLKQLNANVINQSKLISFNVEDTKRKNVFAEEVANEQAIRDDKLLDAINKLGEKIENLGGVGGGKKTDGEGAGGLASVAGQVAAATAGGFLKDALKWMGVAIISAIGSGWVLLRTSFFSFARSLVLSAALRFGGGMALGGAAAVAAPALATGALAAAIVAGLAALLWPRNAGAATGKSADTITGRDAAIDPEGAARRRAAEFATQKRVPTRKLAGDSAKWYETRESKEKQWDEQYGKTHDPETGLLKDPKATTIYNPPAAGKVSSNFGEKRKDATGKDVTHQGVDIAMAVGTDVRPIAPGKVTKVITGGSGAAGTYVQVTHPDGKVSEYMHLKEALAKVGDEVTPSSIIGKSGGAKGDIGAGSSTGPHLHLQLKTGSGEPIDPTSLPGLAGLTKGEKVSPADNTPKTSAPENAPETKEKRPATKAKINNKDVNEFYTKGDSPFETAGGGLLLSKTGMPVQVSTWKGQTDEWGSLADPKVGMPWKGQTDEWGSLADTKTRSLSGTKLVAKNAPIKVEDDKLRKVTENIAKQQGIDPKKSNATQTPTQKQRETARVTDVIKPLYKSNTQLINETNQKFLQGFKSTATRAFTQLLTKELLPNGVGVSYKQAQQESNYRGQQLQKIFGTQAASQKFATGLLGKTYGPMFAPLFNQMAQGYLEVGSRIAGKAIFQDIGGLGAEETMGLTGQVLGNYAAGKKKLAFEQLLFGASGGRKSGIALGPETLLAKYGFDNPAQGISYFAGGLADMATAPLANLMGGDTTNGVRFDERTKKYYNRDGTVATPAEYAAASRQYGASINQGPLFSVANDNFGGSRQAGYNPYETTQMRGGTVVQGYGQQYGSTPAPGQFRVVAPTVNAITGVSTAPTMAQAFGLTPQAQAGLSKEQLEVQQAQLDLARIEGTKRAEEAKAKLVSDAESRAQALGLEKDSAEYNRMVAAASDRGNSMVTMEAARYTVSGLSGQAKEGGGTELQNPRNPGDSLQLGDKGYVSGQLFQRNLAGELGIGKEIGNFAFDMGKNMLGKQLTQNIKNPYMQMIANFGIQKALNKGVDWLFDSKGGGLGSMFDKAGSTIGDTLSTAASSAGSWLSDAGSSIASFFGFADGGIATQATPGVFGEKGAEAIIPLANPNATKALSAAMGTDKQLSALGDQTELLSSINNSLLTISGKSAGSGTNIGGGSLSSSGSSYMMSGISSGGLSGVWSPTSAGIKPGVNAGKPGAPSTMDIVGAIAGSVAKSYLIKAGITAVTGGMMGSLGAVLPSMYGAYSFAGGGAAGLAAAMETGGTLTKMALTEGATALGSTLASGASYVASALGATEVAAAFASEGLMAGLAAMGPVGWAGLAVVGVAAALGYGGGGGGGSAPPPKEPKFHAAIYVTGNNNIDAIAPVYETVDYHAVPDVYKTIAYGLLRVAFNAAKAAESVTKMAPPFDYLYIKVEYNRISLCWGKGAPNANTLATSDANQVGSWGPPSKEQNLNSVASDIVDLINKEFKKTANAQQLTKLDTAAKALGNMTLDQLSSGLIQDLKTGEFKLDKSVEKGIYANNVAESNRIGSLINASSTHAGYVSTGTSAEYDADGNLIKEGTTGGTPMIWSMKDNAYVDATRSPGALLLDAQGRPVYDIPGTSAGLTAEDFGATDVVGIDRPANLYSPTTGSVTSGSGSGGTVISAPSNTKIDNSAVNNFYNTPSNSLDKLRSTGPG